MWPRAGRRCCVCASAYRSKGAYPTSTCSFSRDHARMLFCALASDYDGTLARDGRVDESTLGALRRFKATGKRLILITGRELADLRAVFDCMDDFDAVVVENGAVMYLPATQEERPLAPPPPERFIA